MVKITIYRHGETNWNKKGLVQGITDIPLNLTGLVQAFELGKKIENDKIDLILTSDLSRAHQTARVATKKHSPDIPFVITKNLREINFGDYEAKDKKELYNLDIFKILDDINHPETFNTRIAGGDTHGEVLNRVLQALEDAVNNYPFARNIAVFAHFGVMRVLTKYLNGEFKEFGNCACLQLEYDLNAKKLIMK